MTMDDATPPPGAAPSIEERVAEAGFPPLPRLSWLEVDLDILVRNGRLLRGLLPSGTSMGLVVKADGYGHGMVASARVAVRSGADLLVVATLDEAQVLRDAGFRDRILVLYPVPPSGLAAAVDARLDIVVADDASVAALAEHLSAGPAGARRAPNVHLGIDTGMGRGGLAPERAAEAARRLLDAGLGRLAGTWSHLATPDDPAAVADQVARFETALAGLATSRIESGMRHLDATVGLVAGTGPAYDLVRFGLAFYGVLPPELSVPGELEAGARDLRLAMTLKARALTIATLPAGAQVGYGGTWTADRESVVATVGVGYADGWVRAYAGGSWGVVRGRRVPVIGRISSDALAVDVTDVPGFGPADEVILLAEEPHATGDPAMHVHDLALRWGTISWEVLDAFALRLARVYTSNGRPVGVRYLDGVTRWATEDGSAGPS
jgi:alanine racemase